ncbi:MAG: hypothetical protein M3416_03295 [Acidobacteriota bacterium]|nr:hypothetical protein [Acidobacteriota bacterium]
MAEHALLLMGGIGDFLHYLTRLPAFLSGKRFGPGDLHVFVESLVPNQAEAVFTAAFPQLSFTFLPPSFHWANTFPLLTPSRELDRVNRSAYRYVESLGFKEITDWFLPFLCAEYGFDVSPLSRVIGGIPKRDGTYVVISARDKGFIWWPTRQLCDEVHEIVTRTHGVVYVGTPNERLPGGGDLETLPDVPEALALSYHADLYVGTDTGIATFRELTGKRNIYCVSRFWVDEVMIRYGYFDAELRRRTRSAFAFSREDLLTLLAAD